MKRHIATALPALADVLIFCALVSAGEPLQRAHVVAFGVAIMLNYLLIIRPALLAAGRTSDSFVHLQLLAAALLALNLRGGVLALTMLRFGWPAPIAIVFAVAAGTAVLHAGRLQALPAAGARARWRSLCLSLIVYALVLRLVYLGSVELLPEETYYWNYSRHLDFGYLDHPPMVAWLIRAGTAVFGHSEFAVRSGAWACAAVTSLFAYRLTRSLFGEAPALAALLLSLTLPFFYLSGMLMTPDAPLTAAWAASLYFLERALIAGSPQAWLGAGLCLGLGLLSKYSIGLLGLGVLIFMLWDPTARRWWTRREPYAAALIAAAIFSPVIFWNAQHEWASFAFQTSRRLAETPRFALHKLIASALVLITPIGLAAIALALARKTPPDDDESSAGARRGRFIRAAVLSPLAVFAAFSLRHEVKLDWTGAPWTAALPALAVGMTYSNTALSGARAWLRSAWMPTLLGLLLIYGAGSLYLTLGLPGLGYGKHTELVPVGWRDFSRQLIAAAGADEAAPNPLIVGMDRYAIASELAFYAAGHTPPLETSASHLFGGIGLMYERWTPAALQDGRTLLLVAWDPNEIRGPLIESHFARLGPIETQTLMRDGKMIRQYYYRRAYDYRSGGPQ